MLKKEKKLTLKRETLKRLNDKKLVQVAGGDEQTVGWWG